MTEPEQQPWSTAAWQGNAGRNWRAQADAFESMLQPVLGPLFDHASLTPGQQVLDIGCGRGATTFLAAELVGPSGNVTAVDVSEELIAASQAIDETGDEPRATIEWIVADAQRAELPAKRFDAVISRFGILFFDDPVAAFGNLHSATRPGGNLAISTWQTTEASEFQHVGWKAISGALQANGYGLPDQRREGGPWAFGQEDVVRSILTDANWSNIQPHSLELPLYFGGPGASTGDAVDMAMSSEAMKTLLKQFDERAAELAKAALLEAYDPYHDGTGVRLNAAIMITTAAA